VAREVAGDLSEAEQIMLRGWGPEPDNYWVGLRLAYLALLQGRYREAADRYAPLQSRPEAELDADVVKGHQSAIAASQEKQKPALSPELWAISTSSSLGRFRYRGWGGYAGLPVRLDEHIVVRVAGRFLAISPTSPRSPWAFSSADKAWILNEQYLGLAWNTERLGAEASVARSATTDEAAILGGAAGLRAGSAWGGLLQASYLRKSGVANNVQLWPRFFVWPSEHFGIHAGGRTTIDSRGTSISGTVGSSAVWTPFALDIRCFMGRERWAFEFDGPTILSFDSESTYGGALTAVWAATRNVRLALQTEGARLHQDSAWGNYWSISLGVHYGPELR
jgi:hypothetical protein